MNKPQLPFDLSDLVMKDILVEMETSDRIVRKSSAELQQPVFVLPSEDDFIFDL